MAKCRFVALFFRTVNVECGVTAPLTQLSYVSARPEIGLFKMTQSRRSGTETREFSEVLPPGRTPNGCAK